MQRVVAYEVAVQPSGVHRDRDESVDGGRTVDADERERAVTGCDAAIQPLEETRAEHDEEADGDRLGVERGERRRIRRCRDADGVAVRRHDVTTVGSSSPLARSKRAYVVSVVSMQCC